MNCLRHLWICLPPCPVRTTTASMALWSHPTGTCKRMGRRDSTASASIQDKEDVTNKSTEKSVLLSYFFANISLFHHEKSDIQIVEYFFKPSRQIRYHPVIWQKFLIRPLHLLMPASSSVMPWGIGGYWGMGHFQNNGAAGGLDLRHRYCRCNSFCFVVPVGAD